MIAKTVMMKIGTGLFVCSAVPATYVAHDPIARTIKTITAPKKHRQAAHRTVRHVTPPARAAAAPTCVLGGFSTYTRSLVTPPPFGQDAPQTPGATLNTTTSRSGFELTPVYGGGGIAINAPGGGGGGTVTPPTVDKPDEPEVTSSVPEPAVWVMLLVGFFGTGIIMRLAMRKRAIVTQ